MTTWCDSLLEPVLTIDRADGRFTAALANVKKAVDGFGPLPAVAGPAASPDARDDGLGRVRAFVRALARLTSAGTDRARNPGWGTRPGGDLPSLLRARARIRALQRACGGLAPLLRVQFLKPRTGGRALAAPSHRVALDALALLDAETQLANIVKNLDRRLSILEGAIRLATQEQDSRILWDGDGLTP